MIAHPTMDKSLQPIRPLMRRLGGNHLQGWARLIEGYLKLHPLHQIQIFYHHQRVPDLKQLIQQFPQLDHAGFELRVQSPDEDLADVSLLVKLMESATGPRLELASN